MTRRLHVFNMDDGTAMSNHLDDFDKFVVVLQTLEEPVEEARQVVMLLSSLPAEYELILFVIENVKDITLIEVKEKLSKECERADWKYTTPNERLRSTLDVTKATRGTVSNGAVRRTHLVVSKENISSATKLGT